MFITPESPLQMIRPRTPRLAHVYPDPILLRVSEAMTNLESLDRSNLEKFPLPHTYARVYTVSNTSVSRSPSKFQKCRNTKGRYLGLAISSRN